MVKQVKTKTTLKVRGYVLPGVTLNGLTDCGVLAFTGTSAHVPSVRRCMDVHREEPVVQDGVK